MTTVLKLTAGFLSTLVFLATFAVAGDVLIAALAAMSCAAAQLMFALTAQRRPAAINLASILASLALVLTLTAATLSGADAGAAMAAPMPISNAAHRGACPVSLPI